MDGSIGPMELPTRMQYRFREINKILKQTVYLVPNNGQSDVNAGDTIIVELPQNSVVDFSTFVMDCNHTQWKTWYRGCWIPTNKILSS